MSPSFFLSHVRRDLRGQRWRLLFFLLCLAVGVAAVTSVAGLAGSFERSLRLEARSLLAADIVLEGWQPLPPAVEERLAKLPGSELARVRETVTLVAVPGQGGAAGKSRLVELKAIEPGYPFYGTVQLDRPGRPSDFLDAESVLAQPDLLRALELGVGDTLTVGGAAFTIRGQVLTEPDRIAGAFALGPRLMLSLAGLERAGLVARGSRVEQRLLFKAPASFGPEQTTALTRELRELAGPFFRVATYTEGQPELRRGLERAESFLGLIALLSLLAGGLGVAQTVRAWLASRIDSIAILKCLGVRPAEVLALYVGQTLVLGLLGSLGGILLGVLIQAALPSLLGPLAPAGVIQLWQPLAYLRGLALGASVSVLASLPPLLSLLAISPARVFRRNADPLPLPRLATTALGGVVVLGVFALAYAQGREVQAAAVFTVGLLVVTALLAAAAWGLVRLAKQLRERAGFPLVVRQGLAALTRPGAGTLGAIVAVGLGVLVVLTTFLVEDRLAGRLEAELPKDAPNLFLIDIQPDQWPGVAGLLEAQAARRTDSVPVVTARLASVNQVATEDLAKASKGGKRWALTREQRLTYLDKLPEDNKVVSGALWSDPNRLEVSVEEEYARDLGLTVGSQLVFDVQGVPIALTVTSLRSVRWESFGINFYFVVEPAALAAAPQQRIAAARLDETREEAFQNQLAADFPNVTVLNLREILTKIAGVLRRISLGIRLLGGFTTLAGIAILASAISATSAQRGREVALLKTLGMTRGNVIAAFATEYALIGLTAGLIGTVGAGLLAWAVLTLRMDVPWAGSYAPFPIALAAAAALAIAAGLAASARALAQRPIEVLRGEG